MHLYHDQQHIKIILFYNMETKIGERLPTYFSFLFFWCQIHSNRPTTEMKGNGLNEQNPNPTTQNKTKTQTTQTLCI